MKFTSEKVLEFTSLVYTSELDKAGLGYKSALEAWEKHDKESRLSTIVNYGIPIVGSIIAVVYFLITLHSLSDGSNTMLEYAGIPFNIFLFFYSLKFLILVHSIRIGNMKQWIDYTEKLEPIQIWEVEYPHDDGKRAKLIQSILGARLINITLTNKTAIPMDMKVVDARVSHLVTEIAKCSDDDIHDYLLDETKSFCRQAVKDVNFYSPIITLQDWIESQ